jgi:hypothetical protein
MHNKELTNLYILLNIIRVKKSKACMGQILNAKSLSGNLK